ncbi:MAG TPA: DUF3179 domain-containing protein [Stellaceae bacterium]|nr:DUF3179 domain-containing protein [Stellaceae bacterium]
MVTLGWQARVLVLLRILSLVLLVCTVAMPAGAETGRDAARPDIADLDSAALRVFSPVPQEGREAMDWLVRHGDRGSVAVLIQLLRWLPEDRDVLVARLETLTGTHVGPHWFDWMVWQQDHPEFAPYPGYAGFLADLLARIDPRFRRFVHTGIAHEIRIEEIAWGGVIVDGIPALDNPAMISASAAGYLNSDDPVFGVEINGDARAYPLRIANWHEMVNDVVGGVPVSLAYCTLCGSGILFNGRASGRAEPFTFGSSGLLYRSNKLMYDRQTDSLWNQFTGRPVMGQLTGSNIELKVLPLVLTSWSEWRPRHPDTRVLSLDTGFRRDYGPGVAYRDYFASPELMFPALVKDRRLRQKDLIFGLRVPGGVKAWPLDAFANGTVINDRVGFRDVVLIGDASGRGVRAYEARGRRFTRGASPDEMLASDARWRVTESALIGPGGESLPRLPGHVAYWFAWAGYFENAVLGGPAP